MSDTLRDRLLDRCGLPRDCGWTDNQIIEHVALGLRTNSATQPADDSFRAKIDASVRDVAWALNCHGLDALVGMPDNVLARYLMDIVTWLGRARVGQDRRSTLMTSGVSTTGEDYGRELGERDDERRWDIGSALGWELEDESPSWREVMKGIADLRALAAETSSDDEATP